MNWIAWGWKPANAGMVAAIARTVAGRRRLGKHVARCRRHNARVHPITVAAAVLAGLFLGATDG